MTCLTIRTDKPEAEIGLFAGDKQLAYTKWPAHRQLAESLHTQILKLLKSQKMDWVDIETIVVFRGPGSFTGLRIGLSVGNALALSLKIPIVGEKGEDWILNGLGRLSDNQNDTVVTPEYGGPAHTTLSGQ